MSAPFARSLRSLRADDGRRSIAGFLLAFGLLGAWTCWFFLARVGRVEQSESARLEVDQATHRVEAPVEGKVTAVHLALGAEVAAGAVLIELDAQPLRLDLDEKQARRAALSAQLAPLRLEIETREQALGEALVAGRAQVGEARARGREASLRAASQETEAERSERLRAEGLASAGEAARIEADARARRAAADAQALGAERISAELRTHGSELRADLARLRREATALEGEALALGATIEGLEAAIARRRVLAPIAGTVGEVAALRAGAFVHPGDLIASIVPHGELKVIAAFPSAVAGRLRAGQRGRLRLDAFPWIERGTVGVVVESVATEARGGLLRVELALQPGSSAALPLQHGLVGTAVVDVERVSPATLVLRAAGQLGRAERPGDP